MARISNLLASLAVVLILAGCASRPLPRPAFTDIPRLENGLSRLYVSAGKMDWANLWTVDQIGPFFINNQRISTPAEGEHLIIDLLPGTYELSWIPNKSDKIFQEKHKFTLNSGETRYFACDVAIKKGAWEWELFGLTGALAGALAAEYTAKTYVIERPMDNPNSIPVVYTLFNSASFPSSQSVESKKYTPPSPPATDTIK
jgi:hypothetical protein